MCYFFIKGLSKVKRPSIPMRFFEREVKIGFINLSESLNKSEVKVNFVHYLSSSPNN